jgi:4-hydroxybenzoate polyprenyltransferase
VCGLCVALNVLAYLPSQTFEAAEATEFTLTLALFLAFVGSSIVAWIYAFKRRKEIGLVVLLLLSLTFVALVSFSGSFGSRSRTALQLSYAIIVLGLASVRLLTLRRSAV